MSRHLNQERIVFAIIVLLFALFSVGLPRFLTVENVLTLARSVSVLGILGAGMAIVVIGRGIDLATAKVVAGVAKRDGLHGGEIKLDGEPVRFRVPRPAVERGIVYVGKLAAAGDRTTIVRPREMAALAKHWRETLTVRATTTTRARLGRQAATSRRR